MKKHVLNAAVFARGEDAYLQTANEVLLDLDRRPVVSEVVKTISRNMLFDLHNRLGLRKALRKWTPDIVEGFATAYRLVLMETWEELEPNHATSLLNGFLAEARAERQEKGTEPISLENPDNRITIGTYGLISEIESGEALRAYLFGQPAYQRLETLRSTYQIAGMTMSRVKERHRELWSASNDLAWKVGTALGFLDLLAEIPATSASFQN